MAVSKRELRHSPLVLIHQMGKVGSQALQAMLREEIWLDSLRRDHGLTGEFMQSMLEVAREGRERGDLVPDHYRSLEFQIKQAEITNEKLQLAYASGDPVVIVAGFREPIGFVLSNILQLMSSLVPSYPALPHAVGHLEDYILAVAQHVLAAAWTDDLTGNTPIDMLTKMARQRAIQWWDQEWLTHHGLDQDNFEKMPGSLLWRHDRAETTFVIYRLEDGAPALKEVADIILHRPAVNSEENHSKAKMYAGLYARLKERLRVPEVLANRYLSLQYMTFLYSKEEREALFRRWVG